MDITKELFKMQDLEYKEFHQKLMPTVNTDFVIGIRIPKLREFSKTVKTPCDFLNSLPHKYYEENNLHAFLIAEIKDFSECVKRVDEFLPYIDNWATCDSLRPKVFGKNKERLLEYIRKWIKSDQTYTVRFAIEMLMVHFLDADFKEEYLKVVSKVNHSDYYVRMMIAWYFATALSKQYDSTVKYLENKKLDKWIHNKTISKANDSFRISKEKKEYLKSLRIKA